MVQFTRDLWPHVLQEAIENATNPIKTSCLFSAKSLLTWGKTSSWSPDPFNSICDDLLCVHVRSWGTGSAPWCSFLECLLLIASYIKAHKSLLSKYVLILTDHPSPLHFHHYILSSGLYHLLFTVLCINLEQFHFILHTMKVIYLQCKPDHITSLYDSFAVELSRWATWVTWYFHLLFPPTTSLALNF